MKTNKLLKLTILLVVTTFTLSAQNMAWSLAKGHGGASDEHAWAVEVDGGGNIFVTGSFASPTAIFGSSTLTNSGSNTTDIFIVKYDAAGNVLWAKSFGTPNDDEGRCLTLEGSGNVYVSGYFNGAALAMGSTTLTNSGNDDIFIAKLDLNGNVLWANSVGNVNDNRPSGIQMGDFGSVALVGGYINAPLIIDTYTLSNAGDFDIFFAKFNTSNGNVTWAKGYGSDDRDNVNDIDGGSPFMISGEFSGTSISFGATTLTNSSTGDYDSFTFYIDNNNTETGALQIGGIDDQKMTGVAYLVGTGSVSSIVTGNFRSASVSIGTINITNSNPGTSEGFVAGLSGGIPVWATKITGANDDEVYGLDADLNNNCYLTGAYNSPQISSGAHTVTNTQTSSADIFVASIDIANGSTNWLKSAGSTGDDISFGIKVFEPNGNSLNVFVAGWYSAPALIFNSNLSLSNNGGDDLFVAKLENQAATGFSELQNKEEIKLYPNPSTAKFYLSFKSEKSFAYRVYDLIGSEITSGSMKTGACEIDLHEYANGIYFLEIQTNGSTNRMKLIKE